MGLGPRIGARACLRWKVGLALPPEMVPGSRSGCYGLASRVLGSTQASGRVHGPWAQELKSFPFARSVRRDRPTRIPLSAGFTWDDDLGTVVPSRLSTMPWALTRGAYKRNYLFFPSFIGNLRPKQKLEILQNRELAMFENRLWQIFQLF